MRLTIILGDIHSKKDQIMTKDERRAIRRNAINQCLQERFFGRDNTIGHNSITYFIRLWERETFGYELRIY